MAIILKDIAYSYTGNDTPAVCDISVSFDRGEISAITGPNGCGKTTLAKLITGILRPNSGEVIIDDEPILNLNLAEIGRRIGFVMQHPERQLFCTSVKDEIEFGLKNIGLREDEINERRELYLDYFGLKGYEGKFPFELSTGEKQRLVIASIIAMKPKYLILDEPTSSLDKLRRAELGALFTMLLEKDDIGIILISHDDKFVGKYSTRKIKMNNGQIITTVS